MKLTHLGIATAAVTLLGGAAFAQPVNPPAATPPADAPPAPPTDQPSATTSTTTSPEGVTTTATTTTVPAPAATTAAQNVSFTTMTVTNGPIPDTAENRAKYGQPLSRAGKRTAARGN